MKWTPLSATPIGSVRSCGSTTRLPVTRWNVGLMSRKNWFIGVVEGNETSSSGGT